MGNQSVMVPHLHRHGWPSWASRDFPLALSLETASLPDCKCAEQRRCLGTVPMPYRLNLLRPLVPAGHWLLVPEGRLAWVSLRIPG